MTLTTQFVFHDDGATWLRHRNLNHFKPDVVDVAIGGADCATFDVCNWDVLSNQPPDPDIHAHPALAAIAEFTPAPARPDAPAS